MLYGPFRYDMTIDCTGGCGYGYTIGRITTIGITGTGTKEITVVIVTRTSTAIGKEWILKETVRMMIHHG